MGRKESDQTNKQKFAQMTQSHDQDGHHIHISKNPLKIFSRTNLTIALGIRM